MRNSAGRHYYDRKINEGKTHKAAMRCLKRKIASCVWQLMLADERQRPHANRSRPVAVDSAEAPRSPSVHSSGSTSEVAERLGTGSAFTTAWGWLGWPVVFAVVVLWATSVYNIGSRRQAPWRRELPGTLVGTLWWLVVSTGFRAYVELVSSGVKAVFGLLGGALSLLPWLYLLAMGCLPGRGRTWFWRAAGVEPAGPPAAFWMLPASGRTGWRCVVGCQAITASEPFRTCPGTIRALLVCSPWPVPRSSGTRRGTRGAVPGRSKAHVGGIRLGRADIVLAIATAAQPGAGEAVGRGAMAQPMSSSVQGTSGTW